MTSINASNVPFPSLSMPCMAYNNLSLNVLVQTAPPGPARLAE